MLENWAEDVVFVAEKDLADIKAQIKAVRRKARLATALDEQNNLQQTIQELERRQRTQRHEVFGVEDQIAKKRDKLIEAMHRRMSQKTSKMALFTIRWQLV